MGNPAVFEPKLSRDEDKTLGQILRYMGWVPRNIAINKEVRGVIVAQSFADELRCAVSITPQISLFQYKINFSISQADPIDQPYSGDTMPTLFSEHSTNPTRALQIWQILVGAAMQRRTLTYGLLAELIHYQVPVALGRPLAHIMYWCQDNGLPPLTALVVSEQSGLPSEGLQIDGDLHKAREVAFAYDWYSVFPPSVEELAAAYTSHTQTGS